MSLFTALRGIYEPFNRMKKVIGFDTFEGLLHVDPNFDNTSCKVIHDGGFACSPGYEDYLKRTLEYQEKDNPLGHIQKSFVVKGDASLEIHQYMRDNPETIVSLAFFDFDVYNPTKSCLLAIKDRLVKGSVVAFDEMCDHDCPGETRAVREVFGLNNIRLQRFPIASRVSYFIVE